MGNIAEIEGSVCIRRNPAVPDNIFELVPYPTFGDYARTYGDEIARRYEDLNIIFIPSFPLDLDFKFLRNVTFPAHLKKIGTVNGLEAKVFERAGSNFSFNSGHVLSQVFSEPFLIGYLREQIVSANAQIRMALQMLFPRYYSLEVSNITWRMTETLNEGIHVDGFNGGKPTPPETLGAFHRVKLFVNIDSEPRKWWTSFTVPEILKRYRGHFPDAVAEDADMLNYRVSRPFLQGAPYHEIDIPPGGAVLGESAAISHAVRYGRRMIAAECFCRVSDMLDPQRAPQARLKSWLQDANIAIDPDPQPVDLSPEALAYEAAHSAAQA